MMDSFVDVESICYFVHLSKIHHQTNVLTLVFVLRR